MDEIARYVIGIYSDDDCDNDYDDNYDNDGDGDVVMVVSWWQGDSGCSGSSGDVSDEYCRLNVRKQEQYFTKRPNWKHV